MNWYWRAGVGVVILNAMFSLPAHATFPGKKLVPSMNFLPDAEG